MAKLISCAMRIRKPHESSEVSDGSSSTLRTLLCPFGPVINSETKKMLGGAKDAPRKSTCKSIYQRCWRADAITHGDAGELMQTRTMFGWRSVASMSASFFRLSSEAGS